MIARRIHAPQERSPSLAKKDAALAVFAGAAQRYDKFLPDHHQVPVSLGWLRAARRALAALDEE